MRELGPVAPTAQALRILALPSYFPYLLLKEQLLSCSKGKDKTFVRFNPPIYGKSKCTEGGRSSILCTQFASILLTKFQTCIKEVKFIIYKSCEAFWPISLFIVIKQSYIVVEFWYFSIYLSLCLARNRLLSLSLCLFLNLNALANPQRAGLVFAIRKKTDPN